MKKEILQAYRDQFGSRPKFLIRSPGRVNLIGEHTDYNDGWVLPMAIERSIWIALSPRTDGLVRLISQAFSEQAELDLADIDHLPGWMDYLSGIAWSLDSDGYRLEGWQGVLVSEIPIASGLSSSAALELGLARAFWALADWDWDGAKMAQAAKRMENEWLNLKSGIMDQLIISCAEPETALLIDCRSLSTRSVKIPQDLSLIVMDTTIRRGLIDSAYNDRVAQCQQACDFLGVASLRDLDLEGFSTSSKGMEEIILRRARHVISENARVIQAVASLEKEDGIQFGELMAASHASLRDDYQVSSSELDLIVSSARSQPGCLGARMTGAGFGGCALALLEKGAEEHFIPEVTRIFSQETGLLPNLFLVQPAGGAELISLD